MKFDGNCQVFTQLTDGEAFFLPEEYLYTLYLYLYFIQTTIRQIWLVKHL